MDTEPHTQGERAVKMKAEIRVMHLQAREHQELPANHQKLGKSPGTDPSSQPSEGTNPADTLIADFQPPELQTINFCYLSLAVCDTLL